MQQGCATPAARAQGLHTLVAGSVLLEQTPCALHFSHTALEQNCDRHSSQAEGMMPCNIKERTNSAVTAGTCVGMQPSRMCTMTKQSPKPQYHKKTYHATPGVQPPEHMLPCLAGFDIVRHGKARPYFATMHVSYAMHSSEHSRNCLVNICWRIHAHGFDQQA